MTSALAVCAAVLAVLLSASPAPSADGSSTRNGGRSAADGRPPMHRRAVAGPPFARWPVDSGARARPFPPDHGMSRPWLPRHDGIARHDGHAKPRHGIVAPGPVVYYWPGYADGTPAYVEPPTYYAPPPAYVTPAPPPPPASPTPRAIEYPTGRYELRGDGAVVPYVWVWVPNPPAPPAAAEAAPPGAHPAPARQSVLYTWTDREGVAHWTDNANSVPEEYRAQVQKRSL